MWLNGRARETGCKTVFLPAPCLFTRIRFTEFVSTGRRRRVILLPRFSVRIRALFSNRRAGPQQLGYCLQNTPNRVPLSGTTEYLTNGVAQWESVRWPQGHSPVRFSPTIGPQEQGY